MSAPADAHLSQENTGDNVSVFAKGGRFALLTMAQLLAAALLTLVVVTAGLFAFSRVQWPAFGSSNVIRAITTLGQVVALALLAAAMGILRTPRLQKSWLAWPLAWTGLATFVTVTLGMPLAATRLYLFGISVDQEFRTQYLTRLTDSPALSDMNYADLPSFYPAGWFWIGGRAATLLGIPGWEAFKPYSIGSIAVASVAGMVLWSKLIRPDWAILAAFATTAVTLTYISPEPYGAVVAAVFAPALLLAWGALHRPANGWFAVIGTGVFLGLAATSYTLYLGLAAFTVTLMAVAAAVAAVRAEHNWRAAWGPASRLAVMAAIAVGLALLVWLPFLLAVPGGHLSGAGGAFHYLPVAGAHLPLPMFDFSIPGFVCLVGIVWILFRAKDSRRAQSLGLGVAAIYLWTLLSLAVTALGTTLLSFRLESVLVLLLSAAGVFGLLEGSRAVYQALNEPARFRLVMIALGTLAAIGFAQNIPQVLKPEIDTAYADTDGNGVRADQRAPSAVSYYREIDAALIASFPRARRDTVVLTADTSFLAIYPYRGFQAITSHYANPLGNYAERSAEIERWSKLDSPEELAKAISASPWRPPDAFLFRVSGDNYTLRLAKDSYPNDPNVKRYTVAFPKKLFDTGAYARQQIGPFVLVVRK